MTREVEEAYKARRQFILSLIDEKPGRSERSIIKICEDPKCQVPMSEMTVRNHIAALIRDGIIDKIREKKRGLSSQLFIKSDNILVSEPKQLEEFKDAFELLLDKAKTKTLRTFGQPSQRKINYLFFLYPLLEKYAELTRFHNLYSVMVWPYQSTNPDTLKELESISIGILTEIQQSILKKFAFVGKDYLEPSMIHFLLKEYDFNQFSTPAQLYLDLLSFERDGYAPEGKKVLDILWRFGKHFHPYIIEWAYLEDYVDDEALKLDDWSTLVQFDTKMHPEVRLSIESHPFLENTKYPYYTKAQKGSDASTRNNDSINHSKDSTISERDKMIKMWVNIKDIDSMSPKVAENTYLRNVDKFAELLHQRSIINYKAQVEWANMFYLLKTAGYSPQQAENKINGDLKMRYELDSLKRDKNMMAHQD